MGLGKPSPSELRLGLEGSSRVTLPTSPNQVQVPSSFSRPKRLCSDPGPILLFQPPHPSRYQLPRVLPSSHQDRPRLTWAARTAPQIPEAAAQPPTPPSPSRRRASAVTSASDPAPTAFGAGFRPAAPDEAGAGDSVAGHGAAAGLVRGDVGLRAAAGRAPTIADAEPRGSRR